MDDQVNSSNKPNTEITVAEVLNEILERLSKLENAMIASEDNRQAIYVETAGHIAQIKNKIGI